MSIRKMTSSARIAGRELNNLRSKRTFNTNLSIELSSSFNGGNRGNCSSRLYYVFCHTSGAAEDRLCHARNEEHVHNERYKDHDAGNEVGKPHLNRIISVEGLLQKSIHESGPDEDESACHGPDHRKAQKHIKEMKEL